MEKYIHYCWFGNKKLPKLAKKCIKSWKKYFPEYKIIEWNEKNFDINITKFSQQAYKEGKWAFVSDVARVYALKEMGGIYFDTDMMVIKPVDKEITSKDFFVGWESDIDVAVGVLGASKQNPIIKDLFNIYENIEFDKNNLYPITIPHLLTELLTEKYRIKQDSHQNQLIDKNAYILSRDYFYPISADKSIPNLFTDNTCMIHYYSGSWLSRDQNLQIKCSQLFGEKLGKFVIKTLVFGKRCLKKSLNFLLYPFIKYLKKRNYNKLINLQIQEFDIELSKISSDYVVFYNKNWLGISNSTNQLFKNSSIGITETTDKKIIDYYTNKIIEKNIKTVIFSGFSNGWADIIYQLNNKNNDIIIKIIWHGSLCMNVYDYDYSMFIKIFKLLKNNNIKSIAFVKKSMYEFFKNKGYNVEFLANNVILDKPIHKTLNNLSNKVKIGIYASGDRWVKNFYNQLAAASLLENCIIDCIPVNYKTYELANLLNAKITGVSTPINHDELLSRMASNDLNLYVTFSECAPIIPLESLELNVPCITSNNHHYFENSPLRNFLIVNENDNVNCIYEKIQFCLEHKQDIIEEYKKWKYNYNLECEKNIQNFLSD